MKGNNEIHFNQATMQEIVQHYLDTVYLKTPGTVKVSHIGSNNNNSTFVVKTTEATPGAGTIT